MLYQVLAKSQIHMHYRHPSTFGLSLNDRRVLFDIFTVAGIVDDPDTLDGHGQRELAQTRE